MIDSDWLASQLRARGLVSDAQLEAALSDDGDQFCLNLVGRGVLQESELLHFLGLHFRTRYITTEKLSEAKVPQEVLELLPVETCEAYGFLPVRFDSRAGVLSIVTSDPGLAGIDEHLRGVVAANEIHAYIALRHAVEAAIRKWYRGDVHAFARAEQKVDTSTYGDLVEMYDQRAIDFGASEASDLAPLELDLPRTSTHPAARESQPALEAQTQPLPSPRSSAAAAPQPTAPASARGGLVGTVAELVNIIQMGDGWRQGHSAEVARLVELVGRRMGLAGDPLEDLVIAAHLHEVGKPVEPHLTLLSIQAAPEHGSLASSVYTAPLQVLEQAGLPAGVLEVLSSLYECSDGSGVPGVNVGDEVPVGARLLAVVDAYCDLMSNPLAPGGAVADHDEAQRRLRDGAARGLFDSSAVEIFCRVSSGDALRDQLLGARPRVLLIDADAHARSILELKLVGAGFEVFACRSTAEAARTLLERTMDLVLSEVDVQPVDGLGFLERLRADARTRELPFILVSNVSDPASIGRGLELGALDYITKPYNSEMLLSKARAAISQRAPRTTMRGISGSLREMSVEEILRTLSNGRKSGELQLRLPAGVGAIYFDHGEIVDAAYGQLRGADALYELMVGTDGEFALDPAAALPPRTIHLSIEALLGPGGG